MAEPYQPTPEEQVLLDNYGFQRAGKTGNSIAIWVIPGAKGLTLMAPGYWQWSPGEWSPGEWNLASVGNDDDWYDANLAALLARAALEGLLT